MERIGYDPERDLENPTGSVFCSHGAGFVVPWDQVEEYMHTDSGIDEDSLEADSWYEDLSDPGNGAGDSDNPAEVNRKSAGGMVPKVSGSGEKKIRRLFLQRKL